MVRLHSHRPEATSSSPPILPHCFDDQFSPHGSAQYTAGEWEELVGPKPYRIPKSFWPKIGSKVNGDLPQHYGKCDETFPDRKLYTWRPRHCELLPFDPPAVCKLLSGKQIVVVGDSTVFQAFLSLVHLLRGEFGKDVKHGYVTADLTATACDDMTRLVFIRSDLLLWTHSVSDYHAVQRCDGFTILHPFVMRASRDADLVLLGVGHHHPRVLMLAEKWSTTGGSEAARKARVGFFGRNLNHTLASLLARRASWGHHDPASVVLLGTSTPVRGCARFSRPLGELEAIEIAAGGGVSPGNVTTNELRWQQYPLFNQMARGLAVALRTSFIDVAGPSALRPDGAMGGYWPKGNVRANPRGNSQLDCVHYCLPGVVDTWNVLLYNMLASPRLQRALGGGGSGSAVPRAGAAVTARASSQRTAGRRFFAANSSEWLREKGYAERFERCTFGGHGVQRCEARMQQQPWWPFTCIEPRDRAALRGPRYSELYVPWHPPESFD